MKEQKRQALAARDRAYAEILKRQQEHEAELTEKAGPADMGAAKGKGAYWGKRLRSARRRSK